MSPNEKALDSQSHDSLRLGSVEREINSDLP